MTVKSLFLRKAAVLAILALMVLLLGSCSLKKNNTTRKYQKATGTEEPNTHNMTGVVTNLDLDLKQITIRELESDVDTILNYNATAVIKDKYKQEITGDELQQGQIMNVTYNTDTAYVIDMSVPKDVWEYQEVDSFSFNREENALSLAGRKYQYNDRTYFSTLKSKIQMIELNSQDIVTVRGIGITVYSVTRTLGHGYLRLTNYGDFIGGMINIGNSIILPITENMLITVRDGSYKVTLGKGKLRASKNIIIKEGEEYQLDFSDYKEEATNIGNMIFNIKPRGADLYINNMLVDYSEPVALNYGEYNIRVEMTGYNSYTGVLDVENAQREIQIDLIEEDASVSSSSSSSSTATPSPSGESDNNSNATTKSIDSSHTITVSAPAGAEVYLDNVYKGLAPCTFTKVIGSQTITLSKAGYVTKSYSVDILDDSSDVTLSFAELVEDS